MSLEHDQRLAARDRVEDAHLLVLDPLASRSAPVARSSNTTSANTSEPTSSTSSASPPETASKTRTFHIIIVTHQPHTREPRRAPSLVP